MRKVNNYISESKGQTDNISVDHKNFKYLI